MAGSSSLCYSGAVASRLTPKVQPESPLTALVFRRFNHGSESGVFVCQQGRGTVKLQNLRGKKEKEKEQSGDWHQCTHQVQLAWACVQKTQMRTCCCFFVRVYCNLAYFPWVACEVNLNVWNIFLQTALLGFVFVRYNLLYPRLIDR